MHLLTKLLYGWWWFCDQVQTNWWNDSDVICTMQQGIIHFIRPTTYIYKYVYMISVESYMFRLLVSRTGTQHNMRTRSVVNSRCLYTIQQCPEIYQTMRLPLYCMSASYERARSSAVGWGTVLQARRVQFWFPTSLLEGFSDIILQPYYGPGVDSASNRKKYQEYFLGRKGGWCVGLTTWPPPCGSCLEIWEPELVGILRSCPGL
jgi:hypothetical protein